MGEKPMGNLAVFLVRTLAALLVLSACNRDFDGPYTPGSPGYAGDDWTEDGDGNGVADSLDKYAPDCALSPAQCLDNAKAIARISVSRNSLSAVDKLLWLGDPAQPPSLTWTPAEGAVRGYVLVSSDTTRVKTKDGRLVPVSVGNVQITVTVPGADTLNATFIAKVVSAGKKVQSVAARDLFLTVGHDTLPALVWTPSDATYRDYTLSSDRPEVVRIVGQAMRAIDTGRARITLASMDGGRKTAFSVTVVEGVAKIYAESLRAANMYLVQGSDPAEPGLFWLPENATEKEYKLLLPLETKVISLTQDKTGVVAGESGTVKVLVLAQDGSGKTAEFYVTVVSVEAAVQGIKAEDMEILADSDAEPPLLTWLPANATNRGYFLTSSQPGVALPQNGKIRPLSVGVSEFVVTTEEGGFRDTFQVNVGRPDTSIHVDSVKIQPLSIPLGAAEAKPVITWYPSNAPNRGYTLSSGNEGIAAASGKSVKPVGVGTVEFHLITADGDRKGAFPVTVFPVD